MGCLLGRINRLCGHQRPGAGAGSPLGEAQQGNAFQELPAWLLGAGRYPVQRKTPLE